MTKIKYSLDDLNSRRDMAEDIVNEIRTDNQTVFNLHILKTD